MEQASQQLDVRARGAAARPDQRHQGDSFDAVGHAQARPRTSTRSRSSRTAAITACRSCSFAAAATSAAPTSSRARVSRKPASCCRASSRSTTSGAMRPAEILISEPIEDADLLEATLTETMERTVRDSLRRARRARALARNGADQCRARHEHASSHRGDERRTTRRRWPRCLACPALPKRIECFDVSHTMGERTVASCVVFGPEGPLKSDYRRFNIEGLAPGDDYGAMSQALSRRYARIKKGEAPMPDVLLIDGGPGQLAEAVEVLEGAGDRRRDGRRRRQGRRSPARAGAAVLRRARAAARPAAGFTGAAPDPAGSRRSASIRDHRPPRAPRQGTNAIGPGNRSGARAAQAAGAAAPVRRFAGREPRRYRRPGEGSRHQPQAGAIDL